MVNRTPFGCADPPDLCRNEESTLRRVSFFLEEHKKRLMGPVDLKLVLQRSKSGALVAEFVSGEANP